MRFAMVYQLALAASLTSLACSGAKNYEVNAVFPVEGNEGLEQKVDALLKERDATGSPLVTADRQRRCGLLSILCKKVDVLMIRDQLEPPTWHLYVYAWTVQRNNPLESYRLVGASKEVQAHANAIIEGFSQQH